jgi:hypothetical protein
MYQIETNIPVPTPKNGGSNASVYPLGDMYVGDSFLVPIEAVTPEDRRRVTAATSGYAARHKESGVKFSIRTVDGGLRVWRVA